MEKKKTKWIRPRHAVITELARLILTPYCQLRYGIRVEKFRQQGDRPYLILYNHQTAFDQFFVGMAFRGPIYYMATEDIFSLGWISKLLRWAVAPIPIRKQTTDITAVMNCIKVAREGGTICIAPEGNRTYSGKTLHMNPAIASMAKKLKLPIALYRIEGGYGVQPRWTDKLRRGNMRGFVSQVIEPEEYASLSAEALMERISRGLYTDEGKSEGLFRSKKQAEYLERCIYVCPDCGLSEFESRGNEITCKKCGKTVRFGENQRLSGVGFDFPYSFVGEWYEAQEAYINALDVTQLTQHPLYRDRAGVSEVIVYQRKNLLRENAEITLYGDRLVLDEGRENELSLPFSEVTAAACLGRNKLNIYHGKMIYQFKGGKRFNALKYVNLYFRFRNITRGEEHDQFWDFSAWGGFNVMAVLLCSLLAASMLKRAFPVLKASLIPTSVLGGGILIVIAGIYKLITGDIMFDTAFFGGNGTATLELLTYHCLALGFIASTFKPAQGKMTKKRTTEIFNTGVTTVATYLLQGVVGMAITMVVALVMEDFFQAAGILLPFGFGQGTGQALNYGGIFEADHGFVEGKSFGLTVAALGFLSASIGGVIHLNILRRQGKIKPQDPRANVILAEQIQAQDESPMQESMDKMTTQIALIALSYLIAYLLMLALGNLLPGMKSVIFGFNFLLGVLAATLVKGAMNWMRKHNIIRREHRNYFLMTRASNFFFDLMVVAGIAAIRLSALERYWGIMLILGLVGLVITYIYNYIVAKVLFPAYTEEQFLTMYGMLTGTASTGVILLREIDGDFKTPAADNMVYQNFPAIVFGFPLMLLATLAPVKPVLTLIILFLFFVVMNVILFRSLIFRKK